MRQFLVFFLLFPFCAHGQQYMTDYSGPVFPPNHALNMPIDSLPVHPNSANFISSIGLNTSLHPDFGTSWDDGTTLHPMGIPYNVVGAGQPFVRIDFVSYADESDPGPWPIPQNPTVEGVFDWHDSTPGDRHVLIVDSSSHILYETGEVYQSQDGTWQGACGAVFQLDSTKLRPETWTSADAAGLPIFPLLIRYDEVERALATDGVCHHAVRFTASNTQRAYIWPARHYASSSTNPNRPPMGLRFRLKAGVDISGYAPRMQVILRTLKKYGLIMSDNGSNWYFQGTHDDRWNDDEINSLKNLHGRDFEAVDISPWTSRPGFDPNSAAVPPSHAVSIGPTQESSAPSVFELKQNYPNPFNPATRIQFGLPEDERVLLIIVDVMGRRIATLVDGVVKAGRHDAIWSGVDEHGQSAASGIYFYRLQTHHTISMKKMVLMR